MVKQVFKGGVEPSAAEGVLSRILGAHLSGVLPDIPKGVISEITANMSKVSFEGGGAMNAEFLTATIKLDPSLSENEAALVRLKLRDFMHENGNVGLNFVEQRPGAPSVA